MRPFVPVLAGLSGLVLAAPAAAQEPTSYFFQCTSPAKVETAAATWATVKPATSYTAGAGCGSADPGLPPATIGPLHLDFLGGGTHTGPIHAINVELHSLLVSRARTSDIGGRWELLIDGQRVAFDETQRITPETSSSGASEKYVFSFSRNKLASQPVAPPLAAGDGQHTVQIRFSSRFVNYQNLWVWGATEIPSGVTVNPATLASPKIIAAAAPSSTTEARARKRVKRARKRA